MSEPCEIANDGPGPARPARRYVFSWAFYLFGMVTTAPVFAFFALRNSDPTWGVRFRNGWIDPGLALVVMPLVGAAIGFVLVLLLNLGYVLARRRRRDSA